LAGGEDGVEGSVLAVGEDKVVGGRFMAIQVGFAVIGI